MFRRKTLFVLGAGASFEIGFPLGDELRNRIVEAIGYGDLRYILSNSAIADALNILGQALGDRAMYAQAAADIYKGLPLAISIDNYLDAHQSNKYINAVGKMLIVHCLMESERNSKLQSITLQPEYLAIHNSADSWFPLFSRAMTEGLSREQASRTPENVRFITFNYDRSLEVYLRGALVTYYNIAAIEAEHIARAYGIIHPYGSIAPLPWQNGTGAPLTFGTDPRYGSVISFKDNISTFTESINDQKITEGIKDFVAWAENIVFLGFAFHDQNMKLLNSPRANFSLRTFGTIFGESDANVRIIKALLSANLYGGTQDIYTQLDALTCMNYMQSYFRALTEG